MEKLIELLSQLTDDMFEVSSYDGENYAIEDNSIISEIIELADELLITGDGRPHWKHIEMLHDNDIEVYPGESDSFGWLTDVIETTMGKIIFG